MKTSIACALTIFFAVILYNEVFVYYVVLYQCNWPSQLNGSVKAMILADTHLLGPYKGHWLDKFRREWQMHRAFLSAIAIHQPDVVFILGDIFDEGEWVDDEYFRKYVLRFQHLFRTPEHIPVYSAVGNHDVGFHYKLHPHRLDRMDAAFNQTGNQLITIRDNHFLMINSMTMTDDGCWFCEKTKRELLDIAAQLDCAKEKTRKACRRVTRKLNSYSRPILMQHFPTYRNSDAVCLHHDSPKLEVYREGWEVLSRDATDFLVKHFNPHVAFSGHSHHYCQTRTAWGGEEYTVASFSWRNKKNPSFLLAEFTDSKYAVEKCDMPVETTVFGIYILTIFSFIIYLIAKQLQMWRRPKLADKTV